MAGYICVTVQRMLCQEWRGTPTMLGVERVPSPCNTPPGVDLSWRANYLPVCARHSPAVAQRRVEGSTAASGGCTTHRCHLRALLVPPQSEELGRRGAAP